MVVEINCSTTITTIVDGHKSTKTIVRRETHQVNTEPVIKSLNALHLTNPKRLLTELKIGEQPTVKRVTTNSETEKAKDPDSPPVSVVGIEPEKSDILTERNERKAPSVTEGKRPEDPNSVLTRSDEDVDETIESKENLSVRKESTSPSDKLIARQAQDFNKEVLDMHNSYRSRHGVGPFTINQQLNKVAQEWAQHLASVGSLTHRPNNKYGENLYYISTRDIDGGTPVKAWYDEITLYNFNSPKFSSGTGHFTQVIWKGSKELGVGKATSPRGTFVVCNYNPPGNFLGQFPQNVLPPKSN